MITRQRGTKGAKRASSTRNHIRQMASVWAFRPAPHPAAPSTPQATQQATTQDKPLLLIALDGLAVAFGQPTTQVAQQVGKLLRAATVAASPARPPSHSDTPVKNGVWASVVI